MKAVVQRRYGGPEALSLEVVEGPHAGPGELVVAVEASPVTQGDRRLRAADYPGFTRWIGRGVSGLFRPRRKTPGSYYAGRVVELGEGVERFKVGDRVVGFSFYGAHAERLRVKAEGPIATLPHPLSAVAACGAPYGLGTAAAFLETSGRLEASDRVLIVGASGAVGSYAVQLARHRGAEVHAVTRRTEDDDRLTRLGARAVFRRVPPDSYDIIFDTTGALSFLEAKSHLVSEGRYLTLYLSLGVLFWMVWTKLSGGKRAFVDAAEDTKESLAKVVKLLAEGSVSPLVDRVYPLEEICEAHARLEAQPSGAVVIQVSAARAVPTGETAA